MLTSISIAKNGQAVAVRSTFKQPGVLVAFPIARPGEMKTLVDVNADVLSGIALADAEELTYTSADGVKVQGWLMKPANFDPAKKYPLVLWIHGGPWSMYSVGWSWAFQNWAANGYAVLWTNPRGSTGYGQEFVNGIQFSYPGKDYDDLMKGVDTALAKGWIDKDNLFVCGGSGGGVLTAWIVGKTDRFAGAVVGKPVINWYSFVLTADSYPFFTKYWFPGPPWEHAEHYLKRSPLSLVGNVKTPTMVVTGEEDHRTPISESEQYYQALKLRKVDTALVRIPGASHDYSARPSQLMARTACVLKWFETHKRPNGIR